MKGKATKSITQLDPGAAVAELLKALTPESHAPRLDTAIRLLVLFRAMLLSMGNTRSVFFNVHHGVGCMNYSS